jgi:hypothetical protein
MGNGHQLAGQIHVDTRLMRNDLGFQHTVGITEFKRRKRCRVEGFISFALL